MNDDKFSQPVPPDVHSRHREMMKAAGASGIPEDYRGRLSYLLPFRGPAGGLLVFCGCCQGPLQVRPDLGHWVSWQTGGAIAPLCAVCLEVLRQGTAPDDAPIHVLPESDPLGRRYCSGLSALSPVELAQRRMAEIESRFPKVDPSGKEVSVADVAREAFAESSVALAGLTRAWEAQRAARLRLGGVVLTLQRAGTPGAAAELAGIVKDVPGAAQAAAEAAVASSVPNR